jgi:hypothetical protein
MPDSLAWAGSMSQEMTPVGSQERFTQQNEARVASALVLGLAGANRVSADTADEPPILIGDHRAEVDSRHAVRAADGQGCVGRSWHRSTYAPGEKRKRPDSG